MLKNNQLNRICWIMVIATMAISRLSSSTLAQAGEDDGYQSKERSDIYADLPADLPADFNHRVEESSRCSAIDSDDGYQSNEKICRVTPVELDPDPDIPDIVIPIELDPDEESNRRSAAEFEQEFQTQIDSSASDFKRLQQQKILEQQQSANKTKGQVNPP
jgi:hypothetical protein